jgi:cytochrome P450
VVANGIGLLTQAYEATAGLIGNTLLALARHEEVYARLHADVDRLDQLLALLEEVLRYDPSVHSTWRYLRRGREIGWS